VDDGRRGWIKLWRRLADHDLWISERFSRGQAWADLLMSAAHVDHQVIRGGRAVPIKRGQVFTSQVSLAKRWRWDRETVSKFLQLLTTLGQISDISTLRGAGIGYTLFTVSNYERFQGSTDDDADISPGIAPRIYATDKPAFSPHSEEGTKKIKNGKKGRTRARARDPLSSLSQSLSSNGRPSRHRINDAWKGTPVEAKP
jgi:hypothetical protein